MASRIRKQLKGKAQMLLTVTSKHTSDRVNSCLVVSRPTASILHCRPGVRLMQSCYARATLAHTLRSVQLVGLRQCLKHRRSCMTNSHPAASAAPDPYPDARTQHRCIARRSCCLMKHPFSRARQLRATQADTRQHNRRQAAERTMPQRAWLHIIVAPFPAAQLCMTTRCMSKVCFVYS